MGGAHLAGVEDAADAGLPDGTFSCIRAARSGYRLRPEWSVPLVQVHRHGDGDPCLGDGPGPGEAAALSVRRLAPRASR